MRTGLEAVHEAMRIMADMKYVAVHGRRCRVAVYDVARSAVWVYYHGRSSAVTLVGLNYSGLEV